MEKYYLQNNKLPDFFDFLGEQSHDVYVPYKVQGKETACDFGFKLPTDDYLLEEWSRIKKEDFIFNAYRNVEPIKTFFTPVKEILDLSEADKKVAVFGVKNCDLFSLKIQDYVFLEGDVTDPFYEKRRKNTLLISSDCTNFKESCFCLGLGINPYCDKGFDLNFSQVEGGFIVDAGNKESRELLEKSKLFTAAPTKKQLLEREQQRTKVEKSLEDHISHHKIPKKDKLQKIVREGYELDLWRQEALRCVECGGCNLGCDTCHCFLLSEDRYGNANERIRVWDACLYANFARVAGGANPLKYRYQRLRNRYMKKFDFFPDNIGLNGCCGCGRCIDVCPAKIDIRNILKTLDASVT